MWYSRAKIASRMELTESPLHSDAFVFFLVENEEEKVNIK